MSHEFNVGDEVVYSGEVGKLLCIDDDAAFVKFETNYDVLNVGDLKPHSESRKKLLITLLSMDDDEEIADYILQNYTHNDDVVKVEPLSYDGYVGTLSNGATIRDDYSALVEGGYIRSPE